MPRHQIFGTIRCTQTCLQTSRVAEEAGRRGGRKEGRKEEPGKSVCEIEGRENSESSSTKIRATSTLLEQITTAYLYELSSDGDAVSCFVGRGEGGGRARLRAVGVSLEFARREEIHARRIRPSVRATRAPIIMIINETASLTRELRHYGDRGTRCKQSIAATRRNVVSFVPPPAPLTLRAFDVFRVTHTV